MAAIWIDWSGVLFAAMFCAFAAFLWWRGRIKGRLLLLVLSVSALSGLGMLVYLVYAGLEGRWKDLIAIFLSRATESEEERLPFAGRPLEYAVLDLTWPILLLAAVGLLMILKPAQKSTPESPPRPGDPRAESVRGLFALLAVTGVLWIAIFWRQYERHHYWLFYLGPPAVLLATRALLAIRDALAAQGRRWAYKAMYVVVAGIMVMAFRGTNAYFAMICFPQEEVTALEQINRSTRPDDRVLLASNIVHVNTRGDYRYRSLIPYVAYYLDRAFDVEPDASAVGGKASRYAVYILPVGMANEQPSQVMALRRQFPDAAIVGPYFVFRLSPGPR